MKKPCQVISSTFFIKWFHCLLRCVVYDKEKYKPLGFKRAYGLYSSSLWAFFLLFCIDMFDMFWKVHLIDMFDMFCKVHLRLCFTVYLFFCFYHLGNKHFCMQSKIKTWWYQRHGLCFLLALRFDVSFNRSLAATCSLLLCSLYASSLERSCDVSLIEMSLAERQELPRQGKTIYIVSFFSAPGSKTENGNNPFKLSGSFFILYVYNIISVCFCIVVCKRLHALCIDYLTFRVTPAWYVYSRMTISEHKLL